MSAPQCSNGSVLVLSELNWSLSARLCLRGGTTGVLEVPHGSCCPMAMAGAVRELRALGFACADEEGIRFGHQRQRAVEFLLRRIDPALVENDENGCDAEALGWACECVGLAGEGQGPALVEGGEGTSAEREFLDRLVAIAVQADAADSAAGAVADDSELLIAVARQASCGARTDAGLFSSSITGLLRIPTAITEAVEADRKKKKLGAEHARQHLASLLPHLQEQHAQAHQETEALKAESQVLQTQHPEGRQSGIAAAMRLRTAPELDDAPPCAHPVADHLAKQLFNLNQETGEMNARFDLTLRPILQKLHKPVVRDDVAAAAAKLHAASTYSRELIDALHQVREISETVSVTHGPTGTEASAAEEEEDAMVAALKRSAAISRRSAALVCSH